MAALWRMSLTLLVVLIEIALVRSQVVITANLTPQSTRSNGAYILTHINEVTKVNNDEQWRVFTTYQHTWQFIIILDETWSFSPDQQSSISFTIHAPNVLASLSFDDIILGFTPSTNGYVSLLIPMNNIQSTNKIYPNCLYPNSNQKSDFAYGDIATIPKLDRDCDIAHGDCNNWKNMQPENTQTLNTFPITVTFVNNPMTNTLSLSLFQSDTLQIQTCTFNSVSANQGFKIYVAGNQNGERFDINSFDIHGYNVVTADSPTGIPIPHVTEPQAQTQPPIHIPTDVPITHVTVPQILTQPIVLPTILPTKIPTILADPTCSNGILSNSGGVCCNLICGSCGGSGCGNRIGGASHCCESDIKRKKNLCEINNAPCVM